MEMVEEKWNAGEYLVIQILSLYITKGFSSNVSILVNDGLSQT